MTSKNTSLLCILLLVTLTGSLVSGEVMYIINDIADVVDLKVHCKSAEDDLGVIDVSYQWRYTFSFTQNFAGTTVFACDFMTNSTAFPTTHADVYKGIGTGPRNVTASMLGHANGWLRLKDSSVTAHLPLLGDKTSEGPGEVENTANKSNS